MTYKLTDADRTALEWRLPETADQYVARIEAGFTNAQQIIENEIAECKAARAASPDLRPRAERDADELAASQPTKLQLELAQARARAQVVADLAASKELGLKEAEMFLTAEAAKLEATDR